MPGLQKCDSRKTTRREEEDVIVTPQLRTSAAGSQRLHLAPYHQFWTLLLDLSPGSPTLTAEATLQKTLNFLEPQFLHLQIQSNNNN